MPRLSNTGGPSRRSGPVSAARRKRSTAGLRGCATRRQRTTSRHDSGTRLAAAGTRATVSRVTTKKLVTLSRQAPQERPMTLFRLDASIRTQGSVSREIADLVEEGWRNGHPDE